MIQDLAMRDPVAAYGVMKQIPRVPFFMNARGIFSTYNTVPIVAPIDDTIATRTWITNIDYSLAQPNTFNGNVFKTLYDAMLKAHPGVDAMIEVLAGPKYSLCPNFTPLENIVKLFNSQWASGWVLFKQQSIKVTYQLTQTPPAVAPNAPPYNVTLTFTGWQFLDSSIDNMDVNAAAQALRDAGFFVPVVR